MRISIDISLFISIYLYLSLSLSQKQKMGVWWWPLWSYCQLLSRNFSQLGFMTLRFCSLPMWLRYCCVNIESNSGSEWPNGQSQVTWKSCKLFNMSLVTTMHNQGTNNTAKYNLKMFYVFSHKSDSRITSVCLSCCLKSKPLWSQISGLFYFWSLIYLNLI